MTSCQRSSLRRTANTHSQNLSHLLPAPYVEPRTAPLLGLGRHASSVTSASLCVCGGGGGLQREQAAELAGRRASETLVGDAPFSHHPTRVSFPPLPSIGALTRQHQRVPDGAAHGQSRSPRRQAQIFSVGQGRPRGPLWKSGAQVLVCAKQAHLASHAKAWPARRRVKCECAICHPSAFRQRQLRSQMAHGPPSSFEE